jgi:hypothetical protein
MPEIIILPEAHEAGLAVMLADLIRQNLERKPGKIKPFYSLRAKVLIEATDIRISVGLKFNSGRLTVTPGFSGKPDLHIITDSASILELSLIKIRFGLPYFFDKNGFRIFKKLLTREIVIKGLLKNLTALLNLTKVVSVM